MTKIYRIVYKLTYQSSEEKVINIDFENKNETKKILEQLRSSSVFKKVSYSFLRKYEN